MRTEGVVCRLEAKSVMVKYYQETESASIPLAIVSSLHNPTSNTELGVCTMLGCLTEICGFGEGWVKAGVVEECINVIVNQVWGDEVYMTVTGVLVVAVGKEEGRRRVDDYVKKGKHMRNLLEGKRER